MNRILQFIGLAALLCIGHGQTPSSVDASTTATSTLAPTSTPTPQPPPTTEPPKPFPTDDKFLLHDKNNASRVCLHMDAGLGINVTFITDTMVENFTTFDFMKTASVDKDRSMCDAKELSATLAVKYVPTKNPYFVIFKFKGVTVSGVKEWNVTDIMLEFTFNKTDFVGYNGSTPKDGETVNSSSVASLFDNKSVGLKRSFGCAANRTVEGFEPLAMDMNITLFITKLEVQAFNFTNETGGSFDSNEVFCVADHHDTGNKIVPIAVGAALAGLVIVVLIAYLIGRLRNRKKSSYEALS